MHLYGRQWKRREFEAHVGRIEQVGGVRRMTLQEGPERGVEHVQVRTGAGLSYWVSPDRGLDISLAEFRGVPISWQSPNGDVHPAFFEQPGMGWLRTAAGGLLMTCGMRQAGPPCEDDGETLGIHGRAHHLPASQVSAAGTWNGDEYEIAVSGTVRETRIFGEVLHLHRTIRSRLGENRLVIEDRITNAGFAPSPFMMLYHFNFGFPLLGPECAIRFPSRKIVPREKETPLEGYDQWNTPQPDYGEQVYFHSDIDSTPDEAGRTMAEASISNKSFPGGAVEAVLRWDTRTLPRLVQWKMPGEGVHVLGIEPANCSVTGRARERRDGTLPFLQPGETAEHYLELLIKG